MRHEYAVLHGSDQEFLGEIVTIALADGWELWGNPFASGIYTFNQAIVRQVEDNRSLETAESTAQMPAGYSMLVPETPGEEELRTKTMNPETILIYPAVISDHMCFCFEKAGDNPNCPVNHRMPVSGRIS